MKSQWAHRNHWHATYAQNLPRFARPSEALNASNKWRSRGPNHKLAHALTSSRHCSALNHLSVTELPVPAPTDYVITPTVTHNWWIFQEFLRYFQNVPDSSALMCELHASWALPFRHCARGVCRKRWKTGLCPISCLQDEHQQPNKRPHAIVGNPQSTRPQGAETERRWHLDPANLPQDAHLWRWLATWLNAYQHVLQIATVCHSIHIYNPFISKALSEPMIVFTDEPVWASSCSTGINRDFWWSLMIIEQLGMFKLLGGAYPR